MNCPVSIGIKGTIEVIMALSRANCARLKLPSNRLISTLMSTPSTMMEKPLKWCIFCAILFPPYLNQRNNGVPGDRRNCEYVILRAVHVGVESFIRPTFVGIRHNAAIPFTIPEKIACGAERNGIFVSIPFFRLQQAFPCDIDYTIFFLVMNSYVCAIFRFRAILGKDCGTIYIKIAILNDGGVPRSTFPTVSGLAIEYGNGVFVHHSASIS
nr:MAG TPA: hypothetical protein [Caudoviricetes sp.]